MVLVPQSGSPEQCCSLCSGNGWVVVREGGKEFAARCACRKSAVKPAVVKEANRMLDRKSIAAGDVA